MDLSQEQVKSYLDEFLQELRVFTLATSAEDKPWACPLAFAYDGELNFYCVTKGDSRHIRNIELNPNCSVAMHEHQSPTYNHKTAKGLQLGGKAEILKGTAALSGLRVFVSRFPLAEEMSKERLFELKTARLIRISPTQIFFLDRENIGERMEIELI
jgi:nitroimidazol reductase NimA-like FMN-containing flavoprotein (pyridoxamine 5'-phosphate oxidase superfamily)